MIHAFTEAYVLLTLVVYALSLFVVMTYKEALPPIKKIFHWLPRHWLIAGIVVAFVGKVLDSFYWHLAWRASLQNTEAADTLIKWGTLANIFFRQIPIFIAASCHLWAAHTSSAEPSPQNRILCKCLGMAATLYFLAEILVAYAL